MNFNLKLVLIILCGLSSSFVLADASQLKPFTSDGCSLFPDGTIKKQNLWLHCCIAHDIDYWQGGTKDQRLASDKRLRSCVARVGKSGIATLMLAGVRVGGTPYLPTSFRWGYGWTYPRFYKSLSLQELNLVNQQLLNMNLSK